jgi:hypothetical protein
VRAIRVLWEFKVKDYSDPTKYKKFLRRIDPPRDAQQIRKQFEAATDCGYAFVVAVTDRVHRTLLRRALKRLGLGHVTVKLVKCP